MMMKARGDLVAIPSRRTPAESIQRMEELGLEGGPHITGQHVISKVVMKRFTAPSGRDKGQVCYISLDHPGQAYLRGPAGCGKVDEFLTFASGFLEKLWKKTEDQMHDALLAVDTGTILSSERHSATIKDTIALHFARSLATRQVGEQLWQQAVLQERTRWLRTPAGRQGAATAFPLALWAGRRRPGGARNHAGRDPGAVHGYVEERRKVRRGSRAHARPRAGVAPHAAAGDPDPWQE